MRIPVKLLILAAVVLYAISPVDAMPGPIDDLIVIALGAALRCKAAKVNDIAIVRDIS